MSKQHARDQETMDLTHYLWKAYNAAQDEDFITYIKDKKSQVDDGGATYTAEELMTLAENMYEERLLNENHVWGTPSDEQEQILAMTAEIKAFKQGSNKGTNSNKKGKNRFNKNKSNKESRDKNNKDTKKKNKTNKNWAWKNITPKDTNAKEDFSVLITTMEQVCRLFTTQGM